MKRMKTTSEDRQLVVSSIEARPPKVKSINATPRNERKKHVP